MPKIAREKRKRRPTFLRAWRKYRGLTQDGACARIEAALGSFDRSSLSRIEKGLQPYSQDTLEAMAEAYDCLPAELIGVDPKDLTTREAIRGFSDVAPEVKRVIAAILRDSMAERGADSPQAYAQPEAGIGALADRPTGLKGAPEGANASRNAGGHLSARELLDWVATALEIAGVKRSAAEKVARGLLSGHGPLNNAAPATIGAAVTRRFP
jgi:transcriptional regulator with XRE-family HTH domain